MDPRSKVHPSSVAASQPTWTQLWRVVSNEAPAGTAGLRREESPKPGGGARGEGRGAKAEGHRAPFTHYASCLTGRSARTTLLASRFRGSTLQRFNGFTLLELMIVVAIMGIVLTMGVPLVYRLRHEAPLREAVRDIVEVSSQARARAILQSKAVCVVFHGDGHFEIQSGAGGSPSSSGDDPANQPQPSSPPASAQSGLAGRLAEEVAI